ncbi:MAG: nidogen-like domain-containing protein [Planctomycetota bacterium]
MILTTLLVAAPLLPQTQAQPQPISLPKPAEPTPRFQFGSGGCTQFGGSLCVPLDGSFDVVPFPFGNGACERNDDGSAQLMLNGWSFDFFGTPWNDIWVNNNGNVSFGAPFSAFSSSGFPVSGFPMVAPFWGDVDTRADDGVDGVVWYREWSTAAGDAVNRVVITWDNVGYYNSSTDKLNTFQLILTDGNDPFIGTGNNVCFCYDDMQWTTGSASGGTGGFGGTPATVGANQGNGTDFFLVGRFDQAGNAYDGPGGANDGVDYLDGQQICFSVGSGQTNVPPVFVNTDPNHVVEAGQTLTFDVNSIGPETGQTVTFTNDAAGLANFSTMDTAGNPAISTVTFSPDLTQLGVTVITFTATDDGTPVAFTDFTVEILVTPPLTVGDDLCSPNATNSTGLPGLLWASGTDNVADNDLTIYCADIPANAFGYLCVSQSTGFLSMPGGSQGDVCISGADVGRYINTPLQVSGAGVASQAVDLTQIPTPRMGPVAALAGETFGWQLWYRDMNPTATSNWTNAVRVTFQ